VTLVVNIISKKSKNFTNLQQKLQVLVGHGTVPLQSRYQFHHHTPDDVVPFTLLEDIAQFMQT